MRPCAARMSPKRPLSSDPESSLRRIAGDLPDVLKLTFADGTTQQIEVERGRADQEFEDLRQHSGRYEGGWMADHDLAERYNVLKRKHEGGSIDDYKAAKRDFFHQIVRLSRSRATYSAP
jgi:hypothetical protein